MLSAPLTSSREIFNQIVKIQICSHVGIPTDPDERNKVDTEPIKRSVSEFIKENLPGVETEASIEELCMYTVSKDHFPSYFGWTVTRVSRMTGLTR